MVAGQLTEVDFFDPQILFSHTAQADVPVTIPSRAPMDFVEAVRLRAAFRLTMNSS